MRAVRLPLLVIVCGAWPLFGQPSVPLLTLEEASATAVKNDRPVRIAELEVRKAEYELAAQRTNLLPRFRFDALGAQLLTRMDSRFPAGAFGVFPGLGPFPPRDTSVVTARRLIGLTYAQASQPLTQLHRIGLADHLLELSRDIDREKLEARKATVVNEVKKLYYGILQTDSALDANRQATALYAELDRVVKESLAEQAVLKSDSLEVQTRLATSRHESILLENELGDLKEQMNLLLGRDVILEFRVEPVSSIADRDRMDLASARARALQQRPDLREAELKQRSAELDRLVTKSGYIPDVSLTLQYLSSFVPAVLPRNALAGGLMASWDVFDWGRRKNEMAAKKLTAEQARYGAEEVRSAILVEVDRSWRKLEAARSLLLVRELESETARERVRVAANRYEQKAALLKDVLESQTGFAKSNHDHREALLGFWTAQADFERAIGER